MLNEILKYQDCDARLASLENKINTSNAKRQAGISLAVIKDEQEKLRQLNAAAASALKTHNENKKKCDALIEQINKAIATSLETLEEKQYKELLDKVTALSGNLETLQRNLSISNKDTDNISKNFEIVKKRIMDSQNQFKKAKEEFTALQSELEPEKKKLETELSELEKKVAKDILARYKTLRAEKIFPVFVTLNGSSCGGCRMEVSSAFVGKAKDKGYLECENCRRLVYIK